MTGFHRKRLGCQQANWKVCPTLNLTKFDLLLRYRKSDQGKLCAGCCGISCRLFTFVNLRQTIKKKKNYCFAVICKWFTIFTVSTFRLCLSPKIPLLIPAFCNYLVSPSISSSSIFSLLILPTNQGQTYFDFPAVFSRIGVCYGEVSCAKFIKNSNYL